MRLSRLVSVKLSLEGDNCPSFTAWEADLDSRGTSGSFGVPAEKDDKKQDVESLDNFARERWEVWRTERICAIFA